MITKLADSARRHQLAAFFVLAYLLSWWAWVWYLLQPGVADAPILPFGPFLAALIMLALVGGGAVKGWLSKIVHWRVGPVWYAVALLGPPALTFGAVALNLAVGAPLIPDRTAPGVVGWAIQFVFVLLWIGLGEEPAWRGYALPRLMAGRSALAAALLLGIFHAVWHLPLFGVEYELAEIPPWAISVFCVSVVIAWMWLHTGGSLLLPMLLHAANNSVAFVWGWFAGPDRLRLWWIWAALWMVAAVAVVLRNGPRLTRRPAPDPAPDSFQLRR